MTLETSPLVTDLYQISMLQGYFEHGMEDTAVFEFFVRDLPEDRNFLVAAGLEQALDFLENLRFSEEDITWLDSLDRFSPGFLDYLSDLRFAGEVHAMPEGTIFFPDEPILRVTAPLPQAQLVESRIINLLHYQTLVASKAVRMTLRAPDRTLVDFGLRRAHGAEAGLLASRANYIAGFKATATVIAGQRFGIPVSGTMAHSFIEAHDDESRAFENFATAQPDHVILLIDTYDVAAGTQRVVDLAPSLRERGIQIRGVRLDSGDLIQGARIIRRILDDGGLDDAAIFVSGNLDEWVIDEIIREEAPVDGFGVGTKLDTAEDRPYLDCAYKLQEYAGTARRKQSEGKATWPGRKQVYRHYDDAGRMIGDTLTLAEDEREGAPLIRPVMERGRRLAESPSLAAIRERLQRQLERLPDGHRHLGPAPEYPVEISEGLRALAREVDQWVESLSRQG